MESEPSILGRIIPGFRYPERHCSYCQQKLNLMQAAHLENMTQYKAVFMCQNPKCGAYDEEGHKAYVRVYYSTPEAEAQLWRYRIYMPRPKKQ